MGVTGFFVGDDSAYFCELIITRFTERASNSRSSFRPGVVATACRDEKVSWCLSIYLGRNEQLDVADHAGDLHVAKRQQLRESLNLDDAIRVDRDTVILVCAVQRAADEAGGLRARAGMRKPGAQLGINLRSVQQLQMSHLVANPLVRLRKA